MHRLLFVCSGNQCRSPMGEALALHLAPAFDLEIEARSAGTLGIVGQPAASRTISVCAEAGIDVGAHRSQALTADLIRWADRVVVMEPAHVDAVRALVPELPAGAIAMLGIPDPIGAWTSGPHRSARDALRAWIAGYLGTLSG